MKKIITVVLGSALIGDISAQASVTNLTAQADVDIRSYPIAETTNGYNRTILKIEDTATDPSTKECGKGYIRFQLPPDFGMANSATFTMTRAVLGASAWTYSVYGLDQGLIPGSPWTTATWPELDGGNGSNATTWANAPGNVTTSATAFTSSSLLGTFLTKTAPNGGVVGDQFSITGTNLVNFIDASTNYFVTMLVSRAGVSSSLDQWASKENGTYPGPVLTLDYVVSTNLPASISAQPQPTNQTVYATLNATFTAAVSGTPPITNQWQFDGANLADGPNVAGSQSNILTIKNLTAANAGTYTLAVTNAYGGAVSSNATLAVAPANVTFNTGQLSNIWNLNPGDRPYLNTLFTERGIAYNPFTSNLYVVSSLSNTVTGWVAVLDGATGNDKYNLNVDGVYPGVGSSTLALNLIGTGSDGAVYSAGWAVNLTNVNYHYLIYRWDDDNPGTSPDLVFVGDPGANVIPGLRWGDNFAVRGEAPDVQIAIAPAMGTNFVLLQSADGYDFGGEISPVVFPVNGLTNSGFAQGGLAFGPGTNTLWAKSYANDLYLIQFDVNAQTASVLQAYSPGQVAGPLMGISTDASQSYLAGVSLDTNGENAQIYGVSNLAALPLLDQSFYAAQNPNQTGLYASTSFGNNYLFALDVNNGLKAFIVNTNWTQITPFSITSIGQNNSTVVLAWPSTPGHNYVVQAASSLSPGVWANIAGPIKAAGATTAFTNAISSTNLFYRIQGD